MNAPAQNLTALTRDETFRPWGPRIHVATGTAKFVGIPIWNSTVAIELERPGELLIWNPIALTDTLRSSLRDLEQATGRRVAKLLNPCDYHHASLRDWQAAFPDAETFLVSERIRDQQPGLRGTVLDGDRPVIPGCDDLELLSARGFVQPVFERSAKWKGGPRREWFVFHKPSRSLLIGDLLHLNARVTFLERMVMNFRVPFTVNDFGFKIGDPREREAFLRDALAWDFEQAITVHARDTAHGGAFLREQLTQALGLS